MIEENDFNHLVLYTDGSVVPLNPGYGGAGVFGYYYKVSKKHKNIKHPIHPSLNFTSINISNQKEENTPIEVLKIIEIIKAIENPQCTNNEAELLAFLLALKKTKEIPNLKSVTIYADNNYVVSSFNENINVWVNNNWKRLDGKPIVHRKEWEIIKKYKDDFKESNIDVKVIWIKSHSDDYCNDMADIFSAIGSNSAKRQISKNIPEFKSFILNSELSYSDYKKSYVDKDIIMYFRDLYFSSDYLDDNNYCFLSTSEVPNMIGKRNTATIFASNVGYIPPIINQFKNIFRGLERKYICSCCIKLNKFENKDILRLTELINVEDMIVNIKYSGRNAYSFIRDNTPFMFEIGIDYPFIVNASGLFTRMLEVIETKDEVNPNRFVIDITDKIVKDGKIVFSNKDKNLDFTNDVSDKVKFQQKLYVTIGYDIPSYLALKHIENTIEKVELIVDCKLDSSFCTIYVNIKTHERCLYSVNIENKFLKNKHY